MVKTLVKWSYIVVAVDTVLVMGLFFNAFEVVLKPAVWRVGVVTV